MHTLTIQTYLPFLLPYLALELLLALTALIHLFRHPSCRFLSRWFWAVIIICLQIIGPVIYFTVGRGED
ncbi:MAG: PLDc N-terminal domain-containing protein [Sporolactobacillus sp.]